MYVCDTDCFRMPLDSLLAVFFALDNMSKILSTGKYFRILQIISKIPGGTVLQWSPNSTEVPTVLCVEFAVSLDGFLPQPKRHAG